MIEAMAKHIKWVVTTDGRQWDEPRYGFSITYYPAENEDYRYIASWGEDTQNYFATLAQAKQWCQDSVDEWVRNNVILTEK